MTPIRATELALALTGVGSWREGIAITLGNFSELAARPWSEVSRIEIFPACKVGDPLIVVPEHWMPAGPLRRASMRTIDPTLDGALSTDDPSVAAVRDESVRRSLLALWLPRRTSTGIRSYAPSSWLNSARLVLSCAEWQKQNKPSTDGLIWAHLTLADRLAMRDAVSDGERPRTDVATLFRWLFESGERGVLSDYPRLTPTNANDAPVREGSNIGSAPVRIMKNEERTWQPFSDAFVTEIVGRGLWIQRNLAPQLLDCWSALRDIAAEAAARGQTTKNPIVIERRRKHVASVNWRDANGEPITRLPFPVSQKVGNRFEKSDAWPPRDAGTIALMVGVLQALNLCMVGFCVGARMSEIASAQDDGLDDLATGRLVGRTFKLADELEGQQRDWPLHSAAVRAIEIQQDLARRVRPEGASHLWVLNGRAGTHPIGSPLLNLTEPMVSAVEHLGLSHLTGKDRAHAHRWRHTVGRIVALSVVDAPQVLLDLFGHRDLEMTLRYMLSDPEIAQDAMRVAKETAFVLAEEAVAETIAGEAGGPAAAPLRQGLEELRMRRGEETFGADSLRELADILTFGGKQWELVRPGVICTKAPGQFGPCTQGFGEPDPGSCRTTCDHRLETSRAKAQCDAAVGALVEELEAAEREGTDMLAENLRGQLLAQLRRWEEVRERWSAKSTTVARIWKGE
ncbi:tyrosine-type recombinase/integrase [Methylobacterium sp. WL116]|uniref:tyrosine-type recombinase/integrase n=1 Tax=Methylobacterium sp. WL116 TaxID=2603889 RepID=UPI0011CBF7C9|nr:tyrosine-type recombinase/integrase [Methylobacterium sp. WL116]TXM95308.1 tyrosine-type recombinase/integrase [Methylobacterium sp. WL116]